MTDTGNFAYASGRKDIYLIVAELIGKGIDKDIVYRRVFYNYSFGRMKLMGYMMYRKLRYFPKKNAALITLDYEEAQNFNCSKGDTEGIVNMPLQIKGVRFTCFFREEVPGIDLDKEFLVKATDLVKKNLSTEFNVDTLCAKLHMSRSSLYNKIKALTGHSPSDFVRQIRMDEAATLLKSNQYSIAEISDKLGFGDPKYFTDIFKKHYGVTPSAYMKKEKK
jgi:AraC-like DNA-binding protein